MAQLQIHVIVSRIYESVPELHFAQIQHNLLQYERSLIYLHFSDHQYDAIS